MMIDELKKTLIEQAKDFLTASDDYGFVIPKTGSPPKVVNFMADFAAECIAAERERADRLNAALVEIERHYIENGIECSSCYDLFTMTVLAQEAK